MNQTMNFSHDIINPLIKLLEAEQVQATRYGRKIRQAYENGLLTQRDAMRYLLDRLETLVNTDAKPVELKARENIRTWYTAEYPSDPLGKLLPGIPFSEVWHCLEQGGDVYELLAPADDGIIRERLFDRLSDIYEVDYDTVYNMWINAD